jgi:hypothetical protein
LGSKAEFYLRDRGTKDWPAASDSDAIEMIATKSNLQVTLTPIAGRTIGDIIWYVTSGVLDIPSKFDIPAFPILDFTLDWKTKEATMRGYFTSDKETWKVPYIEYVTKTNGPHTRGTIKRQGNKSTRVSIAGKLSFPNDLVELDAEYVLLSGPLLTESHDIKKYWDIIKNIWNKIMRGIYALRKLSHVVGNAASAVVEGVDAAAGTAIAAQQRGH